MLQYIKENLFVNFDLYDLSNINLIEIVGNSVIDKNESTSNKPNKECKICFLEITEYSLISIECNHKICIECFKNILLFCKNECPYGCGKMINLTNYQNKKLNEIQLLNNNTNMENKRNEFINRLNTFKSYIDTVANSVVKEIKSKDYNSKDYKSNDLYKRDFLLNIVDIITQKIELQNNNTFDSANLLSASSIVKKTIEAEFS